MRWLPKYSKRGRKSGVSRNFIEYRDRASATVTDKGLREFKS